MGNISRDERLRRAAIQTVTDGGKPVLLDRAEFVTILQSTLLCAKGKDEAEWLENAFALADRIQAKVQAKFQA